MDKLIDDTTLWIALMVLGVAIWSWVFEEDDDE